MSNKNEVFEYLIDQLRQQVSNNPYKQQCEDLANEVQSLKNQLRDASAQIKEFHKDNIKKSEHISRLTGRVKELHLALVQATGDVDAYKLIRAQEQSGCRKDDTQECKHDWCFYDKGASMMCKKCGLKSQDRKKEDVQGCMHIWGYYPDECSIKCTKCGKIK